MRRSRFTDEKIVKIIREADQAPIAEVAKRHGISDQTIYLWRRRFGTMGVDDAKRLKSLEKENARLKKLLIDRMLDIEVLKDINAKNSERARSTDSAGLRAEALAAATPSSVRAFIESSFERTVHVETCIGRRARLETHGRARRPISAIRLPPHPHLSRPQRVRHEHRASLPALATGATPTCPRNDLADAWRRRAHGRRRRLARIMCGPSSSSSSSTPAPMASSSSA